MDLRPYENTDRDPCLAVFKSNIPRFFHPAELDEFVNFLKSPSGVYLVMEHEGETVGCGGYAVIDGSSVARLVWGMVRSDLHSMGLGRFLLLYRLRAIAKISGIETVRIQTSQHSAPFFAKQGFKIVEVLEDGFAKGLDRVEMTMRIVVCA